MEADHQAPGAGDIELRDEGESTATTLTRTAAGDTLTPITVTRRRKERRRAVPLLPEVRHFKATDLELRSNAKTDEFVISGSPIVYDTPYTVVDMFGEFQERMMPGVVRDVLPKADVRFLFNHDGLPLARTVSGTLSLRDSDTALQFTATLDARQQLANDLAIAIERGDVSQMSCGFIVARDEWDEAMEDRQIHALADLLDVSAVTYPASPTTSIQVAQRMALAMPVESRARLRRVLTNASNGQPLSRDDVTVLRSIVEVPDLADEVAEVETKAEETTEQPAEEQRSEAPKEPEAPQTSRATRLRLARATRGL